jgi:hypothetical protein
MNYDTPLILTLGDLRTVIAYIGLKGSPGYFESSTWQFNPCYELDN